METCIERSIEYIGYEKLYQLFKRIYLFISKLNRKARKITDNIYFAQYMMKFGQCEDDIYIVAFPKSGTTLMQMILYQLTTDGVIDFKHIYDVSPWVRNAAFNREEVKDLDSPRLIKSHDYYQQFSENTKGRFIFIYRDGMDVAVSLYNQNINYNKKDLEFEKFLKEFLEKRKRNWFNYTKEWLENRKKLPVLYVRYEDLLENKKEQIDRIVEFCNLKVDDEIISRTVEHSSFEFMKLHEDKFGEQPDKESQMIYDQFIRNGRAGEGKQKFSPQQQQQFARLYNKKVKTKEQEMLNC